jgi:hypothetical protein
MRITGAVLVVLGSLLTLTIVWAAVGFLMMGLGLICGLVAERRERRHVLSSNQRPAQLARSKSSRASMRTPAPVGRYEASPTQLSGHGSSPERAFASRYPMPDLERSNLFDPDQDSASAIEPNRENVNMEHGAHVAPDDESLLPGMMSLVAEAVGKGQGLSDAKPREPGEQVYDVDAVDYDWVDAADQLFSADGSTHSSRDRAIVAHSSHVASNGTAQLSEADKEKIEEAEQLIKLLNRMSEPNSVDR